MKIVEKAGRNGKTGFENNHKWRNIRKDEEKQKPKTREKITRKRRKDEKKGKRKRKRMRKFTS